MEWEVIRIFIEEKRKIDSLDRTKCLQLQSNHDHAPRKVKFNSKLMARHISSLDKYFQKRPA
jgi:UPF0288 family protein (methanogenesis marker protein 3)